MIILHCSRSVDNCQKKWRLICHHKELDTKLKGAIKTQTVLTHQKPAFPLVPTLTSPWVRILTFLSGLGVSSEVDLEMPDDLGGQGAQLGDQEVHSCGQEVHLRGLIGGQEEQSGQGSAGVARDSPPKRQHHPETSGDPKVARINRHGRELEEQEAQSSDGHKSLEDIVAELAHLGKEEAVAVLRNSYLLNLYICYGHAVLNPLVELLLRVLGVQEAWVTKKLKNKFRLYFLRSVTVYRSKVENEPYSVWWYLEQLQEGGDLHEAHLKHPPQGSSSLPSFLDRLSNCRNDDVSCEHCGVKEDLLVCSCTTKFFCGEECRELAANSGQHNSTNCVKLEEEAKLGAMLLSPAAIHHRNRANRLHGCLVVARSKEKQMARMEKKAARQEGKIMQLLNQRKYLFWRSAVACNPSAIPEIGVRRQKIVVTTSPGQELIKVTKDLTKKKLNVFEGVYVLPPVRTEVVQLEPALNRDDAMPGCKEHDAQEQETRKLEQKTQEQEQEAREQEQEAQEQEKEAQKQQQEPQEQEAQGQKQEQGRETQEPHFRKQTKHVLVDLGTAFQPVSKVKRVQKTARAQKASELLSLLATGPSLLEPGEEEARKNLLELLSLISHANKTLFKEVLQTHSSVIKDVLQLSTEQASAFVHSLHLTLHQQRVMSTMFLKLWGFNPFPAEKKRAQFEAKVTESFRTSELERGRMELYRSIKDDTTKPCYFARVRHLPSYLSQELTDALCDKFEDPDVVQNLRHANYGGKLRLIFGGDKGGTTTKLCVVLGGGRDPIVLGMYAGADSHQNLKIFFGDWVVQIRELQRKGLWYMDPLSNMRCHIEVKILISGDMAWEFEVCGHSGAASTNPSLYRKISRDHLQTGHRWACLNM